MNHPEFLLLPVLMIGDYMLTVAGARLREHGYSDHFRTRHYELNPIWQAAIAKARWIDPRHLLLTALITVTVVLGVSLLPADEPLVDFMAGALIGIYGTVNGRHIGNLMIFAYIGRHRSELDGTLTLSHELVLWLSIFQTFSVLVPLGLLALYSFRPEVLGAFAGVVALMLVHLIWMSRHRRKTRAVSAAELTQPTAGGPGD